jgi:MGTC/SAPB C-terminal domain
VAAALVLGANTALRPIVDAINRQPIDSTEEERRYLISIDCRAARASDIRSLVVREFVSAAPDVHFGEVDSTFIEDSGRVEVTATLASHKQRGLALEAIVGASARPTALFEPAGERKRIPANAFSSTSGKYPPVLNVRFLRLALHGGHTQSPRKRRAKPTMPMT